MKNRFKSIVAMCTLLVMMCSAFVNADSYSSWKYTGSINGYKYRYRSGIMNYTGEVQARAHTEVTNGKTAPKGYMAARTYLYQKGGALKASSSWAKNSSAHVGIDIAGASYAATSGSYYCIAKFKYKKNSTDYSSVYTANKTGNVSPLKAKSKNTLPSDVIDSMSNVEKEELSAVIIDKDGFTYGSGLRTLMNLDCPDYIAAIGEDGVEGYVSSKELAAEDDQNATIIEMRPGQRDVRFINLYSNRGEIIGKFRIETNCIALDDKEE